MSAMQNTLADAGLFQPADTAYAPLTRDARGWLQPTDDYWRLFLARPELAPVPESCDAERALHAALLQTPALAVTPAQLRTLQDADARESYGHFLRFRDAVRAAGTLEAYYLGLFPRATAPAKTTAAGISIPPLFIDLLVEAITRNILADAVDAAEPACIEGAAESRQSPIAYTLRAADMLHRRQRVSVQDGQVLAGDGDTLDMLHETGGVGDMGRFLAEAGAPLPSLSMQVLGDENAAAFLQSWCAQGLRSRQRPYLLDLTHEVTNDLSHGLVFTMTRARSGLKALAGVLQQWVQHFLGVAVTITPLQKIDDSAWRWHVGLDAQASALLNDLYLGHEVEPARLQRLVSLFRLEFADPREMRADVAGKPVYLGLMMNADGVVKLKPQNLLLNLPLRAAD